MIIPNWPAPKNVRAFTSLREDAHFDPPFSLEQVHQSNVVVLPYSNKVWPKADSAVTRTLNTMCSVRTADCLPILITNKEGNEVAAIHAGWKGLIAGVIEATFNKMHSRAEGCMAWIGPAICSECFEIGGEVREAFIAKDARFVSAFKPGQCEGKWLGDLPKMATMILQDLGVPDIYLSGICTMEETRCNSYRREKATDERMLTCISFS